MHLNEQLLFEKYARSRFQRDDEVLEIAPASIPSPLFAIADAGSWRTAGIERDTMDGGGVDDVMSDEYTLPYPAERFDVVVSSQVIEHVRQPWTWMIELARVCRVGGCVITLNPVSWPYHEAPVDCWRIFPEGMRALGDVAGLTTVVSVAESLEPQPRRRYFGAGRLYADSRRGLGFRLRTALGWPTPVSLDTITIAEKRAPSVGAGASAAGGARVGAVGVVDGDDTVEPPA